MPRALLSAALILVLTALSALSATAQEAPVVNALEIRGLKRIGEGVVRSRITHRTGEPLVYDRTTSDIREIYGTGYFRDVRVEVEPFEGGVKLIYIVSEKPVIIRIEIHGYKELEEDKVREKLTVSNGAVADNLLIAENAEKLRVFYEEEGFPLANVVPILRFKTEEEAILTFQIEEGEKVRVSKVTVTGNKNISSRKILKAIKSSNWKLWSFFTKSGTYKKEQVTADTGRIKNLYLDHGYLDAAVSDAEVKFSDDRKKMELVFRVSEGEKYTLSSTAIQGNSALTTADLEARTKARAGAIVSRKAITADVSAIRSAYTESGYAAVDVLPDIMPDEAARTAALTFKVDEGGVYTIGRIEIIGNSRTRDKVIRRELLLDEGDRYNSRLIMLGYRRINNLNFFERVEMKPKPNPAEKTLDLDIEVKERSTGFFSVGGGYSSVDHLIGMIEITQGNLGGRGQYLKLKAELGGKSTLYQITFRDPWFLDRPVSFMASVYKTEREYTNYDKKATGFQLGFGKRFREYWRSGIYYKYEAATILEIDEDASVVIKEQEGKRITSSITPNITRDSRDSVLNPHEGSKNSVYFTYAGIGGDNKFVKTLFDSSWFFPAGRATIAVRGRAGFATGISGETLPLYERFYVGGINTIRGLGHGEGGPKDENGDVIGGKRQLILNLEYIFPLISELGLKGVTFVDIGSAFDESPDDIRYTTGLGIRWISPLGPLRVEWGYNLDKKPGEKSSRWEFTFGSFF